MGIIHGVLYDLPASKGAITILDNETEFSRAEHNISRKDMPPYVLKVLYRLKSKGFMGMLVGGALRDLFRNRQPRDFDVVTDAPIQEIRNLFRNSRIIGKRFPIVHTYFGNEVVEISSLKGEDGEQGYPLVHSDALRRDFTVNAVFYNIDGFKVIDPLQALAHVKAGKVVCIGDPGQKFSEDSVRMLRALKLVAKQGFVLDPKLEAALFQHAKGATGIGPGRKYEELTRIILDPSGLSILALCARYKILRHLWPQGKQLMHSYGLAYFDEVSRYIPIDFSRGSFAKHSHTHLWMRLYLDSPYFKPTTNLEEHKTQFEAFLVPLAMPFRGPIVEAAVCVSHMILEPMGQPSFECDKEVRKLLQYYLEFMVPGTLENFYQFVFKSDPKKIARKRTRRRRRGGRARSKPPP